jgi:hypothetical protein
MRLTQIFYEIAADTGDPEFFVFKSDYYAYISYKLAPITNYEGQCVVIKFEGCNLLISGYPNDENISSHRFHGIGLEPYGTYEVEDSDIINQLEIQSRVHPRHNKNNFECLKHYIFCFHDSCLEVICKKAEYTIHPELTKKELINMIFDKEY